MKHEILEEVWRARDKISAECGYDLTRLAARMRRLETQYADRLVQPPPRPKTKSAALPIRKRKRLGARH
jgi:hypothetical protein